MNMVTKPVLANDSHRQSVTMILNELTAAYQDGRTRFVPKPVKVPERKERFERRETK